MAARWAHNPKVVGSNPTPATKAQVLVLRLACRRRTTPALAAGFLLWPFPTGEGTALPLPRNGGDREGETEPSDYILSLSKGMSRARVTQKRQQYVSPGGKSVAAPPVPIPNTEVKRHSAHDTAPAKVWENRSLPGDYFLEAARRTTGRFCARYPVFGSSRH